MTEQRKAIAYTRVSTDEKAILELSPEAQRIKVTAHADRSGLTIVEILTDEDESASTLNRPAMSELLTHIDSGRIDAVIISKLDRLTRRIKDFKSLLQRMRKAKRADGGQGVDLISSAESLDTGSDTGQIVFEVVDSMSQWDREVIGERTSAVLQERKAQGRTTGNPPFGYAVGEGGVLIENEREQAILKRVAQLREQGKTWQIVADTLTAEGVRTRRGTAFSKQGILKVAKGAGVE
ncbi:MAG: hypothetical protein F4Z82_20520 [Caldilineaceae bacterium SB0668_bin_21]|nr:hypothetical protein [Caldilineaceae bacterium SB0668_bin_21]MYC23025.1 hypothetical protein [Caldilineaceae bacterium SB0662_bin_25]